MLYLVRHAKTRPDPSRNPAQWDLDAAGEAQKDRMGALPHWATAYRICSSTEPKAMLTAAAIRQHHPQLPEVEPVDELRELYKASWVGNNEHDAVMARVFAEPDKAVLPGWERAADGLARITACIGRLVAEAEGRDLIVVSHATILSIYLAWLQGQERVNPADWAAIGFPDYALVDPARRQVLQRFGDWQ